MLALEKINNRWELDGIKYVTMKYLTVVYQIDTNYASVQAWNGKEARHSSELPLV